MITFTLLALTFLLLVLFFKPKLDGSWRESFLKASTLLSFLIVLITEGLSFLKIIEKDTIFWCWLVILISLLIINLKQIFQLKKVHLHKLFSPLKNQQSIQVNLLLAGILFILLLTFFLAMYVPPNVWDTMSYRLPRVERWIQQKSLDLYPVANERQLYIPPFTEFIYLHIRLLSQSTNFLNIIEWISMVCCLMGISLITKKLGGNRKQQIIAAFLTATLPMGVLQAYSTQTDYVVSLFSISCFYWMIRFDEHSNVESGVFLSLSLGLALLSKPTAAFLLFPLLTVFLIRKLLLKDFLHFIQVLCLISIGVIIINGMHWMRVYSLYGSALGKPAGDTYLIEGYSPQLLLSNGLKNISLELASPLKISNRAIENFVRFFHQNILGISLNDPRTTWQHTKFYIYDGVSSLSIGDPIYLILIVFSLFSGYLTKKTKDPLRFATFGAITIGFLLELMLMLWQPWITRLHLFFLIALAPYIAIVLSKKKLVIQYIIFASLFFFCLYCVAFSIQSPLVGESSIFKFSREDLTYFNHQDFKQPFRQAAQLISAKKSKTVGFCATGDEWEFPLWKELHALDASPHIRSLCIQNQTLQLNTPEEVNSIDDVMVCVQCYLLEQLPPTYKYNSFVRFGERQEITFFFNK